MKCLQKLIKKFLSLGKKIINLYAILPQAWANRIEHHATQSRPINPSSPTMTRLDFVMHSWHVSDFFFKALARQVFCYYWQYVMKISKNIYRWLFVRGMLDIKSMPTVPSIKYTNLKIDPRISFNETLILNVAIKFIIRFKPKKRAQLNNLSNFLKNLPDS